MSDLPKPNLLPQQLAKDLFWASSKCYEEFGRGAIHIDLNDPKLLKIINDYGEGRTNKQKLANNLSYIPLSLERINLSGDPDVDSLLKDLHDIIFKNEEATTYNPSVEGIGILICTDIPVEISESYEELMALIKITRFGWKKIKTIHQTERKQEGE
jgi:hypothetical protein